MEAARAANEPISVALPDGKQVAGVRGVTTPLDVANQLSKSLAKKVVVAKVDGAEWDLFRPLRADCALQLLTFDDDLGKHVRGTVAPVPTVASLRGTLCSKAVCASSDSAPAQGTSQTVFRAFAARNFECSL